MTTRRTWADRFVIPRSARYQDEITSVGGKQNPSNEVQGVGKAVTLSGIEPEFWP